MRFLVDANLPRSTLGVLARARHQAEHARDLGLGGAPDSRIAAQARRTDATLITRDLDFADIHHYPPEDYQGILVLRMPDDAVAQAILALLERFLQQTELIARMPGHLVILETDRVRFRPALE